MTSRVFLCVHCGARNRVPERWKQRAREKCEKCGAALFPSEEKLLRKRERSRRHWPFSFPRSVSLALSSLFVFLAAIAVLHLSFVGLRDDEGNVRPIPAQLEAFSSTVERYIQNTLPQWLSQQGKFFPEKAPIPIKKLPPPVFQHPGAMWNKTGRSLLAPFGIQTSAGSDYYIKLVDAETNRDAMAIYVVGGKYLEVSVPLGSYKMRYAYGKIWRGEQHLFGPEDLTRIEEALKSFDFLASVDGINGYTVELIPQVGGNLPTHNIARDEF